MSKLDKLTDTLIESLILGTLQEVLEADKAVNEHITELNKDLDNKGRSKD